MTGVSSERRLILQRFIVSGLSLSGGSILAQNIGERVPTPRERLQQLIEDAGSEQFSELIVQLPQTKIFASWLKASELLTDLDNMAGMTVFAPTDAAWPDRLRSINPSRDAARALILKHVIAERWNAINQPQLVFSSMGGVRISVDVTKINDFAFELTGLRVRNGFVHLMTGML